MPTYERFAVLTPLLRDAGFKLVDIGGRGEALQQVLPLAPMAHYYVSEPDAAEAQRLREQVPLKHGWRGVTVFAEAIWCGSTTSGTIEPKAG